MIKLYIYRKLDGLFLYEDIGSPDYIITDLADKKDFTTTPIPDNDHIWYWQDARWQTKPK